MRAALIAGAVALALGLAAAWFFGGFGILADWALEAQRAAQNRMAGALRALRGGQPGALAGLIGLAFLYGLLHAAGPGHGKVLIGGYGLARPVGAARLLAVALVASLAQAAVAVAIVLAGAALFGWGREELTVLADGPLMKAGTWAVLLIGALLALRGLWHLSGRGAHGHLHGDHHHHHHHHHHHDHIPDAAAVARATSPAELAALIGAVAIRPCSGALILMVLTLSMGIPAAGIAATFAMGLGTFATIAVVALAAGFLRAGALEGLAASRGLRYGLPLIEIAAGGAIVLASATVLARGF